MPETSPIPRKTAAPLRPAALLLFLCGPAAALEATVQAPDEAGTLRSYALEIAARADLELRERFGLRLPDGLLIRLLPEPEFRRLKSPSGDLRYDGFAAGGAKMVAVSLGYLASGRARLADVLRHELWHAAAAGLRLPRWFDEGMAMLFSGSLFPAGDGAAPPRRKVVPPVASLDLEFASGDGGTVRGAYEVSYLFVRRIRRELGPGTIRKLLELRRKDPGGDFEEQFRRVSGRDLDAMFREFLGGDAGFWSRAAAAARSLSFFTWTFLLLAVVLVAGGAVKWKRYREILEKEDEPDGF